MRSSFLILILFFTYYRSDAQPPTFRSEVETEKPTILKPKRHSPDPYQKKTQLNNNFIFNKEALLEAALNTNGWKAGFHFNFIGQSKRKQLVEISLSELKHDKEVKQRNSNPLYAEIKSNKPFIFGKRNNLYDLRFLYGRENTVFPGLLEDRVSLNIAYKIGLSMALLKPYYLNVIYFDSNGSFYLKKEKYEDANPSYFLNPTRIKSAAKWTDGLNELRAIPGISTDLRIVFEKNKRTAFAQNFSLGATASVYICSLPIMANQIAYFWQANLFVGMALGGRWK